MLVFIAGASDRATVLLDVPYTGQIDVYRVLVWVLPLVFAAVAYRLCEELQAAERVQRDEHEAEAEARLART